MTNQQYNFKIEIPKEVISENKHNHIFEHLLKNKIILGFCGYSRSGKDTVVKKIVSDFGYHRVAFTDNVKLQMNKYLKEAVCLDLNIKGREEAEHLREQGFFVDYQDFRLEEIDFFTEDLYLKEVLRPYIIWYAEKLREINGKYYWNNTAFEIQAKDYDKIALSDIRRIEELDLFINSNYFKKKTEIEFLSSSFSPDNLEIKQKDYSSLLFYVNKLGHTDSDLLTQDCIRFAQENWLFNYTFYIDPRLPKLGPYRNNSLTNQVNKVAKKFGISKPDKKINPNWRQTSILDS